MIELTLELVDRLAGEVVAEYGEDYVYQKDGDGECKYVEATYLPDGEVVSDCSCLVGHILHRAGVDLDWLSYDNERNTSAIDDLLLHLSDIQVIDSVDDSTNSFLLRLQQAQDIAMEWGDVLKAARQAVTDQEDTA